MSTTFPRHPALPSGGLHPSRPRSERLDGVECVDPTQDPDWDASLASLPEATIFHTAAWANVLKSAYRYRPTYLVTRSGGDPASLLPLMSVASWLTGRRGVSLPFTDEAAIIAPDQASFEALLAEARALARRSHWKYLELRGGRRFLPNAPAHTTFWGHILDLTPGEATLFSNLESANRRAIRKAEQNQVQVEFSRELAPLREFHQLLCLTRRRHGVPPQPFRFFAAIQRHLFAPGHGCVALARHHGRAIAGAVYFTFGAAALYKYGASDEGFQHLRGNNLVMWEAIKRFSAGHFRTFDFGRTDTPNEGLRKFKLSWGATERSVEYFREDRSGAFTAPAGAGSARITRLFQSLPTPAARLIGVLLYKHVA